MSDMEIDALAEDIKKHGQREPGLIFEGQVLDGWHRYLACAKLGGNFRSEDFTGDDPVAFVLSKNLHRRHLTASQRASAIVATHNWRPVGDQRGGVGTSTDRLAQEADVSEKTIRHAKDAERVGLGPDVREGRVSAKAAARVAGMPKAKREKAVQAIRDGTAPSAPKPKKADDAKLRAELIDVQGKYADLAEKNAELADTARELADKLLVFETTDLDEQQKEIAKLQKRIVRLEAEVQRVTIARNECQNKNNELIRQVRMLQKNAR